tara:strand:+ start:166 stop:855 length:690 start_codon:yes stop_codon:yes gene_type:complete
MNKNILLIEDEAKIQQVIKDYFNLEGFNVQCASDGLEGLDLFEDTHPDLVILDVMLPGMDGWSVLKRIRKHSDIPVIMLTARSDDEDKLMGFELRADEYVTKPFSPRVLVARAKTLLMRVEGTIVKEKTNENSKLEFNGILIEPMTREVAVDDVFIELSKKEYDILYLFMKSPGRVLTRQAILDEVWGYEYFGDERVVDTHIKKLRKKLSDRAYSLKTIFGVGYKFEVK